MACYEYDELKQKCVLSFKCHIMQIVSWLLTFFIFYIAITETSILQKMALSLRPFPVVTKSRIRDGSKPLIFEYGENVIIEVINVGESGDIIAEVTMYQYGKKWVKRDIQYVERNEKKTFRIQFDEVELGKGNAEYKYRVYAK